MKLSTLTFLLLCTLNAEKVFLLPEGYKDFLHTLRGNIKHASKEIFIVSSNLNTYHTTKLLRQLLDEQTVKVSMVTHSVIDTDATMLSKYKNFSLALAKTDLDIHFVLTDPSNYCISSTPLNYVLLKSTHALAFCGSNSSDYQKLLSIFIQLKKRSSLYLPTQKKSASN